MNQTCLVWFMEGELIFTYFGLVEVEVLNGEHLFVCLKCDVVLVV